jgi:hypothetical protein
MAAAGHAQETEAGFSRLLARYIIVSSDYTGMGGIKNVKDQSAGKF